jgi:hypothetical protein
LLILDMTHLLHRIALHHYRLELLQPSLALPTPHRALDSEPAVAVVLGVSIKNCFMASPPFPEFVARKKERGRNKVGVQGTGALMEGAREVGRRPFMRRMPLQDDRAR